MFASWTKTRTAMLSAGVAAVVALVAAPSASALEGIQGRHAIFYPSLELVYQHDGSSPGHLVAGTGERVPESWSSPMRAGSCLVFDDRLLHRGLANDSNSIRHVAYFSYRQKGYSENTHFESQRSVFDSKP